MAFITVFDENGANPGFKVIDGGWIKSVFSNDDADRYREKQAGDWWQKEEPVHCFIICEDGLLSKLKKYVSAGFATGRACFMDEWSK